MIAHVVLFRPRADLDSPGRHRLSLAFSHAVREIGSIRRARIGRRVIHGRPYEQLMQEDYTHAAILEFDDLDGLNFYLTHPAHDELGLRFLACFERALIYDFDLADGERGLDALVQTA